MSSRVLRQQLTEAHELDKHQARYLSALFEETRSIALEQRTAFLEDAAELLSERPHQAWDELTEALSQPNEFAAAWVAEQSFPPDHPDTSPSWTTRARRPRNLVLIAIVSLFAIAGGWTYSYFTATPRFDTPCSGAQAPSVETLQAAGQVEYRMPLVMDARYGVGLCLQAFEGGRSVDRQEADVVFDRIYLARPLELAVQPVGWEIIDDGVVTGDASQNRSAPVSEELWLNVMVWFEGDRCNTSGSIGFDSLSVDYTYRGRKRTGTVDLEARYSIEAQGLCTSEVRAHTDAKDSAWSGIASSHFNRQDLWETNHLDLGSVELTPVAVSRDLCRYLRGIQPPENGLGQEIEPLSARAVFRATPEDATVLIDGAVFGICPEFAEQRDALQEVLDTINA